MGGWEVPCDNTIRNKTGELRKKDKSKTPAENMLIAWNKVGFNVEDPTATEIADYQSSHTKLPAEKLTNEAVKQQLIIMEMEVAIGTYRDQSVAAYKEMYSHLGKMMQISNNSNNNGNDNEFKVDTSQAIVSANETAAAQSKWTPARGHILNWGSGTNRKQFYANLSADGKKRLCDTNPRLTAWLAARACDGCLPTANRIPVSMLA